MDTLSQKKPRALTDPAGAGTRETPGASDVSRGTWLVLTAAFTAWSHCAKFKMPVADGCLPQTSCKDWVPREGLTVPVPVRCPVAPSMFNTSAHCATPPQARPPFAQTRLLGFISPDIDNCAPVPMIPPQVWVFLFFFPKGPLTSLGCILPKQNCKLRFYNNLEALAGVLSLFQYSLKDFFAINFHNFLMSQK